MPKVDKANCVWIVTHKGVVKPQVFDEEQQGVDWANAEPSITGSFKVSSVSFPGSSKDESRAIVSKMLGILQ